MEHIFFEVQLCIGILIFKEKHVFPILIILCLVTSLKQGNHRDEVRTSSSLKWVARPNNYADQIRN